jgi:hypothetical protein
MNWEQMSGDERARFCSLCNLHVYNIAELTRKQAEELITRTEGRICGRVFRRSDGTVITKDCPFGLRAIRRRVARATGAIFATVVALTSSVSGQKPSKKDDPSCKQQVTISRTNSDNEANEIKGTVVDPNGGVVPKARIKITERKSRKSAKTTSDAQGDFRIPARREGVYDIVVEHPGFAKLVANVTVRPKEAVTLSLILTPEQTVTVGVIGVTPMIDTSSPTIRTIITREMIDRLPIP